MQVLEHAPHQVAVGQDRADLGATVRLNVCPFSSRRRTVSEEISFSSAVTSNSAQRGISAPSSLRLMSSRFITMRNIDRDARSTSVSDSRSRSGI